MPDDLENFTPDEGDRNVPSHGGGQGVSEGGERKPLVATEVTHFQMRFEYGELRVHDSEQDVINLLGQGAGGQLVCDHCRSCGGRCGDE